ncbi:GntR family transcriptional regulator [Verminephrobacter eiseniae]|uniref:GntR family transcriptional regulator n=1 Tax=Verminephrobacter eiseniae TaxID=364317 RepID=UPI00223736FF|nr:GntR family transcriptional regulator [Verminephrobacter eiseniae]MCW5231918.1 GntR family transcriptional regulator [Verminephrobacter eiseniae]MCW5293651.1 GntR family transcriptional regulator [Verminephrobacter eiseniae]MCW8184308.1 GntR family transcriptional regulator [Verminephrobacter eiseniae]MCW8225031.1 GntR family transcriptional regulator [Verminephrobacter eiseniae]MCW8233323.1 GntR family transcriptional regulator [Verminephrobacter eiseniae]
MATGTNPIERSNLASQIYEHLREQLMSATFQPGQRLKIRELAKTMGTSETPVREALIQLVRDHALEMKAGHFIRVRMLSLAEYVELREIRLALEPLAAERAVPLLDDAALGQLGESHRLLMHAEKARDYRAALQHNFDFHFGIYRRSGMPQLTGLLDRIWMQVGPMMNFLYPHGHPHYDGVHQHLNVLRGLQARDVKMVHEAIRNDLIEGGRGFVRVLQEIDAHPERADELLALRNQPRPAESP